MMRANLKISGLSEAERVAREILEHVEAIKRLQRDASYDAVSVEVELLENEKTASGN
jgi:hypothetical protein